MDNQKRIILGIDPSLSTTGFAVLSLSGSKNIIVECGYVTFESKKKIQAKVKEFYDFLSKKIDFHHIKEITIETPFLGKNSASFLKLGYLRAIVYLICEQRNLTIHEFAPRTIKQAITGYGNAEKEQVKRAIILLFPQLASIVIKKYDITDAVAIALCGLWRQKNA